MTILGGPESLAPFLLLYRASGVRCASGIISLVVCLCRGLSSGDARAVTELRLGFACGPLVIAAVVSDEDAAGAERNVDCALGVSRTTAPATGFVVCAVPGLTAGDAGAVTESRLGFACGLLFMGAIASDEDAAGAERNADCALGVSRTAAPATGFVVCPIPGLAAGDAGAATEPRSGVACGLLVIAAVDSDEDAAGTERDTDGALGVSREAVLATSL